MIYVIMHKIVETVNNDLYKPLLVGSFNKKSEKVLRDDSGDNISKKNENYCELTGLYWIWKNVDDDIVGLCHYRRFLAKSYFAKNSDEFLSSKDLENDFANGYNTILPKKEYSLKKVKNNFKIAPNEDDMKLTRKVISDLTPEYLEAYDKYVDGHTSYLCNVIVAKKKILDEYCEWVFNILFEIERRMDKSTYINDPYRKRMFGFISERLLNIWILKNKDKLKIKEYSMVKTDENFLYKLRYSIKQNIKKIMFKN